MVETEGKRDEVARVSLVSTKGVLLDEFVLPEGKITDYRTQYSGITAEHLASCKNSPSFCHVFTAAFESIQQRVFTEMTKIPSILVGHSLENDLAVLKLVHNHIIDTAVRYTHPTPSYKHSLRDLVANYLNRSIQGGKKGHDPREDAKAALDLAVFYASGVDGLRKERVRNRELRSSGALKRPSRRPIGEVVCYNRSPRQIRVGESRFWGGTTML